MAPPTTPLAGARAGVTTILRWLSSAVTLVSRPDRDQALLERHAGLSARLQELERHSTTLHLCLIDSSSEEETKVIEQSLRDIDQAHELADTITQRAGIIRASQKGEQLTSTEVKPTPSALLGKLPTLDIPTYDGDLRAWMGFINLFDSLVDSRQDLSPSQKLAYLRSALRGEAAALIQHLIIDDNNYQVARSLLTTRFQNVRLLADTHVAAILALPKITRASSLRRELLNPLLTSINTLRRLDLPVDQWSFILLHLALSKLPLDMKGRFEQRYGGDSASYLPPFTDLVRFLEDECRMNDCLDTTPLPAHGVSRQEATKGGSRAELRRPARRIENRVF